MIDTLLSKLLVSLGELEIALKGEVVPRDSVEVAVRMLSDAVKAYLADDDLAEDLLRELLSTITHDQKELAEWQS